mgnify:CR=1 FL=1
MRRDARPREEEELRPGPGQGDAGCAFEGGGGEGADGRGRPLYPPADSGKRQESRTGERAHGVGHDPGLARHLRVDEAERHGAVDAAPGNGVVYLHLPHGVGRSKFASSVIAGQGPGCTMRNWRTVIKLLSMADELG